MTLSEPNFIERDVNKITQEMVAYYEAETGKTLQPAQQERLMIDLIAYRESLIRIGIQEAAKQNLVSYAGYPMLDYLGEFVDTPRLEELKAKTVLRAVINTARTTDTAIPSGTQIESKDSKVIFTTLETKIIPAGALSVDINAECETAGIIGNGYLPEEVKTPVGFIDVDSISNISTTAGGAEEEENEAYRERIKEAPEHFSTAGPGGAYKYLAKSAHQDIIDVAVILPQTPASVKYTVNNTEYTAQADSTGNITGEHLPSGSVSYKTGEMLLNFEQAVSKVVCTIPPVATIKVYPLTKDGSPSQTIIDAVETSLDGDTKIPLTDNVIVEPPVMVDYSIEYNVTLYDYADPIQVKAEIESKLSDYIANMKTKLGKDIVPAQITALIISVVGVYNAIPITPEYRQLQPYEWANGVIDSINITGVTNG